MAKPQEKTVTFLMTPCSPVTEHHIENDDDPDDVHHNLDGYDQDTFLCNGCSCFGFFPFNLRRSSDESNYNLLNQKTEHNRESWVVTKLKKMREVSEKLAGPKWKNLIRKMSGYLKKNKIKRKNKNGRFHYSPQSYAMNFDESDDDDDDDVGFSSRFAPPPSNSKSNSNSNSNSNPNPNPNPTYIVDDN